jgi:hypothetical protein
MGDLSGCHAVEQLRNGLVVRVIPANKELMIACHTLRLLKTTQGELK